MAIREILGETTRKRRTALIVTSFIGVLLGLGFVKLDPDAPLQFGGAAFEIEFSTIRWLLTLMIFYNFVNFGWSFIDDQAGAWTGLKKDLSGVSRELTEIEGRIADIKKSGDEISRLARGTASGFISEQFDHTVELHRAIDQKMAAMLGHSRFALFSLTVRQLWEFWLPMALAVFASIGLHVDSA